MNKKIITLVIVLTLFLVTAIMYVQINKMIFANRVTNFLLEGKKYSSEEIEFVKGVWGFKLPSFYSVVTFKDEPYVEYIYFAHDEVLQFGYRMTEEGKEEGLTESDLKYYDPLE